MDGKHVVVTGAAKGIGYAIAETFANAGASVTLMGRGREGLEQAVDRLKPVSANVRFVQVDITEEASVTAGFAEAVKAAGPVEVLINNAGISGSAPAHQMTLEHFDQMMATNARGTFMCIQQVLSGMMQAKSGRIINVVSTAGLKGYAYVAGYVAAKHAAMGLTRALALELAPRGITVNAVCPGFVETPMTAVSIANIVEKTGRTEEEARAELSALNPQKRLVQPQEVADACLFLARPDAHSVNGQAIAVDGGETA